MNNVPITWHAPRHTSHNQPIKITLQQDVPKNTGLTRRFRPSVRETKYKICFNVVAQMYSYENLFCCNLLYIFFLSLVCPVQYSTWNLPFIHPGNRLPNSFFIASMLIQLPNWPLTPSFAAGIDSLFSSVQMYVLDSTRATSRGSVRAKKLWNRN